eukprot:m51a1_g12423 putative centrosomal protein of 290 kda (476) ;mRNA; r:780423-782181
MAEGGAPACAKCAESEAQIAKLQKDLAAVEAELEKAYEEVEMAKADHPASGPVPGTSAAATEELKQLRHENDSLARETKMLAAELQRHKDTVDKLSEERKRFQEEAEMAQKTVKQLEEELEATRAEAKDLRTAADTQQSKLASTLVQDKDTRAQIDKKNAEIAKYLKEIETLAKANKALDDENHAFRDELKSLALENDSLNKQHGDARDAKDNAEHLKREAEHDLEDARAELEGLRQQLREMDEANARFCEEANSNVAQCQELIEQKTQVIARQAADIEALRVQLARANKASDMQASMRETLARTQAQKEPASAEDFRELIRAKDKRIAQLEADAKTFSQTVAELNDEIDRIEGRRRNREMESAAATRTMSKEAARALELEQLLKENREQMDRYDSELARAAEEHLAFIELRDQFARWESEDLNNYMRAVEDLREENRVLREKLGMGSEDTVDLSSLKLKDKLEMAQQRRHIPRS